MTADQPGGRLPPIDFKDLADALLSRADTLVPMWLPGGARRGAEWVCGGLGGGSGHSCSVNMVNGRWADFSGDDAGGDLISLYAAVRGMKQGAAARELQQDMGWQAPLPVEPADKPKKRRSVWVAQDVVPEHAPAAPVVWSYKDEQAHRWVELTAVRTWDYLWQGQCWGRVARFERASTKTGEIVKDTLPQTWCLDTTTNTCAWRWKMWEGRRPLYVPRGELSGRTVVVVEGEKCALALHELCGHQVDAVSWPGGVNAVDKAHWEWLAGACVVLWADTDSKRVKLTKQEKADGVDSESKPYLACDEQPGRAAMLELAGILRGHGCTVTLIDTAEPGVLPDGWDVADAIADGWTADQVMAHIHSASAEPAPAPKLAVTLTDEPPAWVSEPVPDEVPAAKQVVDARRIGGAAPATGGKGGRRRSRQPLERAAAEDGDDDGAEAEARRRREERVMQAVEVLSERYTLIYGTEQAWDHEQCMLIKVAHMRLAWGKDPVNVWLARPSRRMRNLTDLVFWPGRDAEAVGKINMFSGMELQAVQATAEDVAPMLELLRHLCSTSADDADEVDNVVDWILSWMAYPLQHIGTKMRTAIVMHGPQGSGKNLFWDTWRDLYGKYGKTVGQTEIEDKFNEWVSCKLAFVANEVVSRAEIWHKRNALKMLVTEAKDFPIRGMHTPTRWEDIVANTVFLSNERVPLALDDGDRRHLVVYTPQAADQELYDRVAAWLADGGLAKWLGYLQSYDTRDFGPHTKPPMTRDKQNLVQASWRPPARFAWEWLEGYIHDLPVRVCSGDQLYQAFLRWCQRSGERWPPNRDTFTAEVNRWADDNAPKDPITGRRGQPLLWCKPVQHVDDTGKRKSIRTWIPEACQPPEGVSMGKWAFESAASFQADLDRYLRRFLQQTEAEQ